jgi:hypothetical protein
MGFGGKRSFIRSNFALIQRKLSMKRIYIALLTFGLLIGFAGPASAGLVVNGGFETGDFSNWIQGGNTGATFVDGDPHSGNNAAWLGPVGSHGTLTQVVPTVAGTLYELDYWLKNGGGGPVEFFSAALNGVTIPGSVLNNPDAFDYKLYAFQFTATGPTSLQFEFQQDPDYFRLDDVDINQVSQVPEPASLTLLGIGIAGMAGYGWRRWKKAQA